MIGMFVAVEHAVQPIDIGIDELLAQIRRGVDQDAGDAGAVTSLDQERRPPAAVLRIVGIASAPTQRGPRHAGGRAAAEDGEFQGHAAGVLSLAMRTDASALMDGGTLLNSRKKLSDVCCAISARETPRVSARTFAV